ncbi:GD15626 [Drosophila simulans]|uniref:GD15626 n=1 Tax=Drosophila simulans TaxID=7240 RepID=B4R710_DROSI|nr:GD15626 [Drosophila simulans]
MCDGDDEPGLQGSRTLGLRASSSSSSGRGILAGLLLAQTSGLQVDEPAWVGGQLVESRSRFAVVAASRIAQLNAPDDSGRSKGHVQLHRHINHGNKEQWEDLSSGRDVDLFAKGLPLQSESDSESGSFA